MVVGGGGWGVFCTSGGLGVFLPVVGGAYFSGWGVFLPEPKARLLLYPRPIFSPLGFRGSLTCPARSAG